MSTKVEVPLYIVERVIAALDAVSKDPKTAKIIWTETAWCAGALEQIVRNAS